MSNSSERRTTKTIYVRVPEAVEEKINQQAAQWAITKREVVSRALADYFGGDNLLLQEMAKQEKRLKDFMLRGFQSMVEQPLSDDLSQPPSDFDRATRVEQ